MVRGRKKRKKQAHKETFSSLNNNTEQKLITCNKEVFFYLFKEAKGSFATHLIRSISLDWTRIFSYQKKCLETKLLLMTVGKYVKAETPNFSSTETAKNSKLKG